ncbi:MAG: branched-chain amino acid ABC transporter permease [Deltaproteobacteria bacterium]|nr:branched-chain amino acid ABC transporter permease [Deltaproteobacteria bacterium]MBW1928244.1 branched-chain amino acid ABC transporter permease [Deltaproteobacteria bacterium]MBW2026775.1 branched-chain amino acid ABC transporter permease [Deltaproteobacteria bacterium]MBW2126730.1 branched-chain amino acid ABC transporter permease [Deltaproteobacteria bacterium]
MAIWNKKSFAFSVLLLICLVILPFFLPRFYTYILASIFVMALLAMSLNLVVGHGGLYQFHHCVFYGVSAYTVALIITKTPLPYWVAFVAGPIVAMLVGFFICWFCVRLSKLYFAMLQISLGSLVWALAFRWYSLTGGDDGIHGVPMPEFISSTKSSYYFILIVLVASLIVLYLILKSPFGATLQATRDNPERCEAVGINVRRHQLVALVISTFFAGVAGVLYVILEQSVFPDLLFWVLSLEIFIMCLLGGWFTFAGPMLGAAIMVSLRTFVGIYTEYWTLVLGIILILLIFFLPEGVMGFLLSKFGSTPEQADNGGSH